MGGIFLLFSLTVWNFTHRILIKKVARYAYWIYCDKQKDK